MKFKKMKYDVKIVKKKRYRADKCTILKLNFSFELCQLVNWLHPFFHSHADRQ